MQDGQGYRRNQQLTTQNEDYEMDTESIAPSWETAARIWMTPKDNHAARIESEKGLIGLGRAMDCLLAGLLDDSITITGEAAKKLNDILRG